MNHQQYQRLIFIQKWYVYGEIGREASIVSSFQKTNQLQNVLLPIRPNESTLNEKHPELTNRKHITFRITQDCFPGGASGKEHPCQL